MVVMPLCSTVLCSCTYRQRVEDLGVWIICGEEVGRTKKQAYLVTFISVSWNKLRS